MTLLKIGVDPMNVHPYLWERLGHADAEHERITGARMVATSIRRPHEPDERPSRHSPPGVLLATGADIRRHRLDELGVSKTVAFCEWMQSELGLGVLLEPDWMTPDEIAERGGLEKIDPHIHAQLKIQPEELGFEWTE